MWQYVVSTSHTSCPGTRLSLFSACDIDELGNGLGTRLHAQVFIINLIRIGTWLTGHDTPFGGPACGHIKTSDSGITHDAQYWCLTVEILIHHKICVVCVCVCVCAWLQDLCTSAPAWGGKVTKQSRELDHSPTFTALDCTAYTMIKYLCIVQKGVAEFKSECERERRTKGGGDKRERERSKDLEHPMID